MTCKTTIADLEKGAHTELVRKVRTGLSVAISRWHGSTRTFLMFAEVWQFDKPRTNVHNDS